MKAYLHYGIFLATIEMKEPKMDFWVVEPTAQSSMRLDEIAETDGAIDANYNRINKLHFRLLESPRIGQPLEYKFIEKD